MRAKAYHFHSATSGIPQLQRRCSCHRQSWRTAYRPKAKPEPTDWHTTNQPHAALVCRLKSLHPRDPRNYMDSYSFTNPRGMVGWVGLVGWSIVDNLPTKCSDVNYRSGVDQEMETTNSWKKHREHTSTHPDQESLPLVQFRAWSAFRHRCWLHLVNANHFFVSSGFPAHADLVKPSTESDETPKLSTVR